MIEVIGSIVAAILFAGLAWFGGQATGKAQGRTEEREKAIKEALEDESNRLEAGRRAVGAGRGRDPDDRLRDNDGRW